MNIDEEYSGPNCPGCGHPGNCPDCEYMMNEVKYTVGIASQHNPQGQLPGLHITVTAELGGVSGEVSGWYSSWKDKEGFMASGHYVTMCRCALHSLREKLVAMYFVVNSDNEFGVDFSQLPAWKNLGEIDGFSQGKDGPNYWLDAVRDFWAESYLSTDEDDLRCIVRWFDRRRCYAPYEEDQKNYKVSVITEIRESREEVPFGGMRSPDYPVSETVEVRAHSELDARVMAFILVGHVPDDSTPTWLIAMAHRYTEIIP